ncbi:DNA-directed RNA polymerase subunit delta [Metabacillus sp. KIGAM252]|uniref:Probable DNA-directed RNA polymerase subunit delta n=1 Tax=Metabacillus flavus TaxID=2823519 RepID=A0ABS5LJI9_9BACI|nr:DNA-directed RNA polymerase subunit delta [Metabacillus flavus]MBS2970887.1 DNA-directed RNA polymerase subunit delta [Metabacillus flavus]
MSLKQYSKEEIKDMALIEIAHGLMTDKKEPVDFKDLMKEITKLAGLTQEQVEDKIAQFYTDLNIDGRFIAVGDNKWGLRNRYPVDTLEEEMTVAPKAKKKKTKKAAAVADDFEEDDFEEADEEEDLDFDDLEDYDEEEEAVDPDLDDTDVDDEDDDELEIIDDEDLDDDDEDDTDEDEEDKE